MMMAFDQSVWQVVVLGMKPIRGDGSVHVSLITTICEDVEAGADSYMAASGTGTLTFGKKVVFRSLESADVMGNPS
jgi:hypothetical protein